MLSCSCFSQTRSLFAIWPPGAAAFSIDWESPQYIPRFRIKNGVRGVGVYLVVPQEPVAGAEFQVCKRPVLQKPLVADHPSDTARKKVVVEILSGEQRGTVPPEVESSEIPVAVIIDQTTDVR